MRNEELWSRLSKFSCDEEGVSRPFSWKLSQEQTWTKLRTARVIEEYRKFIYLS